MPTKIEWCDYTINPVKGLCPMACSYCYARRMYKRFKWNPEIWYEYACLPRQLKKIKTPSKIFIGSTMELFGDWIHEGWLTDIFRFVKENPQHTFIFLTKQPQKFIKYSPYPSNVYIGVSVTNQAQYDNALRYLKGVQATVKFLSIEPLLEEIKID